jgi:hypothetical protein
MANASRPGGAGVRELAPKRSWGKVLFKTCILLVMAVVGAHWGWGKYAGTRFERELARYRAAGEPIDPSDFDTPASPDEENAVVDLLAAAELIDWRADVWDRFRRLELTLPLDESETTAIDGVLRNSRDALRRLDVAMTKPAVHLNDAYQSSLREQPATWSPLGREFPEMLRAAGLLAHQRGDDQSAMARVRQLLLIARVVQQEPSNMAQCAVMRIRGMACDLLLQIAPDLQLGDGSAGSVTAAEVRSMIEELMDDDSRRRALVRSLQGERVKGWDYAKGYADGRVELFQISFLLSNGHNCRDTEFERGLRQRILRPFALNDAPILVEHYTDLIAAVGNTSNWPALLAKMPTLSEPREVREHPWFHLVASALLYYPDRMFQVHFHGLTEQHLAATALALHCFAADHAGQLPADLDELVPTYLLAIPSDPMAPGGRRLGYIPNAIDPILYSVGDDGKDDGGNGQPIRSEFYYHGEQLTDWRTHDAVIHLSQRPRIHRDLNE